MKTLLELIGETPQCPSCFSKVKRERGGGEDCMGNPTVCCHTWHNSSDLLAKCRDVREDALDAAAALARKHETLEFLELADKIEALKTLP